MKTTKLTLTKVATKESFRATVEKLANIGSIAATQNTYIGLRLGKTTFAK